MTTMTIDTTPRVKPAPRNAPGYVAWTPTWEGPARPEWCAAMADLRDRLHDSEYDRRFALKAAYERAQQ